MNDFSGPRYAIFDFWLVSVPSGDSLILRVGGDADTLSIQPIFRIINLAENPWAGEAHPLKLRISPNTLKKEPYLIFPEQQPPTAQQPKSRR